MRSAKKTYLLFLLIACTVLSCTKPYEPDVIQKAHQYLVVDGFINAGLNAVTQIDLSRTRQLYDTVIRNPEAGAAVFIDSERSGFYHLREQVPGTYVSDPLQLDTSDRYALRIRTTDGREYRSAFVPVVTAPAIDSLTWNQEEDVSIYLYTHDPHNKTRYYKWTFSETWEYHSAYTSHLGYENGQIIFRDSADYQQFCWRTQSGSDINTGSSIRLQDDVISRHRVHTIPAGSSKLGIRYSIAVQQQGLTTEAFDYWQILQKNTQNLGSLFDAQPSQLKSNFQNIGDASEPVIGFLSAANVSESRIFIDRRDLGNWQVTDAGVDCSAFVVSQSEMHLYLRDPTNAPAYFVTGGGLAIAKKPCVDCMVLGGVNKKPAFW